MADIFEEVDEGLRQERYREMFRRYAPWAGLAMALIIALVGGREYVVARATAEAAAGSDAYAAAVSTLNEGDVEGAQAAFAALSQSGPNGYAAVAKMREAGIALETQGAEEAATLFEEAAELTDDRLLKELALIKAAYARADSLSYSALESRVAPLAEPGRPYEFAARELLAASALKAGEQERAQEGYRFLSLSADAPAPQRARAERALAVLRAREWAQTEPAEPAEETEEE